MAGEVALGAFGDASSTPSDENVFREAGVGVLDLDEGVLNSTLVEVFV